MAASIASRGRPTPSTISRPGSISRRRLFAKPDARRSAAPRTRRAGLSTAGRSRSAPTPIPISRSRRTGGSRAPASRCWPRRAIRSRSPPSPTACSRDLDLLRRMAARRAGRGGDVDHLARPQDRAHARAARAASRAAAGGGAQGWPMPASPSTSRSRRWCRRSPITRSRHLVERAAEAGARGVFFLPVRLPHEVAPLFRAWLEAHHPDRAAKVMATIQSIRGGRDNDPDFFTRMKGQGPWAELIRTRVTVALPQARARRRAVCAAHRSVRAAGAAWHTDAVVVRGEEKAAYPRAASIGSGSGTDLRVTYPLDKVGGHRFSALSHASATRRDIDKSWKRVSSTRRIRVAAGRVGTGIAVGMEPGRRGGASDHAPLVRRAASSGLREVAE